MVAIRAGGGPRIKIGNQFASITQIEMSRPHYDISAFDSMIPVTTYGLSEINFSGIAMYTPEILKAVEKWMYGIPQFPHYAEEFMCLYCGSPQSILRTHCAKCGAPRSFLLG